MASPFPGQFLIAPAARPVPPGFTTRALPGGMVLSHDPVLPVIPLRHCGAPCGWLLGLPIHPERGVLRGGWDLPQTIPATADHMADGVLEEMAGSFVLLVDTADGLRLYPDAAASMGVVYDPAMASAAASAQLLLGTDYDARRDPALIAAFDIARDGWCSAGLTAHRGLSRLLPGHALDLRRFAARRHWPVAMPEYAADPAPIVRAIGREVAQVTRAAGAHWPLVQALTGGNDSRALLAANREICGQISFVTLVPDGGSRDGVIAARLARIAGIALRQLPMITAAPDQAEAWLRRAGHSVSGANHLLHPSVAPLDGMVLIGGMGGEVGRGVLWPAGLAATDRPDAGQIVALLKLGQHGALLAAVERWLAGVPAGLDAFQLLDLAYLELRLGPWAFAQGYPLSGPRDLHPLISRAQFRRMWSLPPAFRRDPGFVAALVEQAWPELGQVPVNRYGNARDWLDPLAKAIRRPDLVRGKWRQWRAGRESRPPVTGS